MKGDSKVNWKRLAERTGMPIGTIRAALKGRSGRPRKLLLETLAMPTDGGDSKHYIVQPSFIDESNMDSLSDETGSSLWDTLEGCWQMNVKHHSKWKKDRTQVAELQREIHMRTTTEETTNER